MPVLGVATEQSVLDAVPAPEIDPTLRVAIWDAVRSVPYAVRERRRTAVRLQREGMSQVAIAAHMQIGASTLYRDQQTVLRVFREHGLEPCVKKS